MERDPRYVEHVLAPRCVFACQEELPYLIEILVAHTSMLRRQRILGDEAATATVCALRAIADERMPPYDQRYEDIFFVVEERAPTSRCAASAIRRGTRTSPGTARRSGTGS